MTAPDVLADTLSAVEMYLRATELVIAPRTVANLPTDELRYHADMASIVGAIVELDAVDPQDRRDIIGLLVLAQSAPGPLSDTLYGYAQRTAAGDTIARRDGTQPSGWVAWGTRAIALQVERAILAHREPLR